MHSFVKKKIPSSIFCLCVTPASQAEHAVEAPDKHNANSHAKARTPQGAGTNYR